MATREELEAQIAAIDKRLANGAERIQHGDTSVLINITELRKERALIAARLRGVTGAAPRVRHVRTYSRKGL